jgi:superfamily II DNA helicase RecQ
MQAKIFTIPFHIEKERFATEEFDAFCASKRVLKYQSCFFQLGERPCWTVFVTYELLEGGTEPKKASRKIAHDFTEAEQTLMKVLRAWRKETAEQKGLPAYLVATNKQFVEMIRRRTITLTALGEIDGYGKKRLEAYGKDIIKIIKDFFGDGSQNG